MTASNEAAGRHAHRMVLRTPSWEQKAMTPATGSRMSTAFSQNSSPPTYASTNHRTPQRLGRRQYRTAASTVSPVKIWSGSICSDATHQLMGRSSSGLKASTANGSSSRRRSPKISRKVKAQTPTLMVARPAVTTTAAVRLSGATAVSTQQIAYSPGMMCPLYSWKT